MIQLFLCGCFSTLMLDLCSLVMRAAQKNPAINIVAVNDPFIGTEYAAYMYKYGTSLLLASWRHV